MSTIVVRVNSSDTISAVIKPAVSFTGTVGLTPAESAVTYSADGTTLQLVGTTFSAVTQAPTNGGTGLTTADQVFDYVASNPGNFVTDADVTNHGIGDFSDVNDGTKAAATGDLLVWNNVASEFQRGGLSAGEGVTFVKAGNDIQINAPLSEDTSPSLGGDLDVSNYEIVSSTSDITINPGGAYETTIQSASLNLKGAGTTNVCELKMYEATSSGTNYISFKPNTSLASDLVFTLPSADGTAGQVLSTNGSGLLSFTNDKNLGNRDLTATAARTYDTNNNSLTFRVGGTGVLRMYDGSTNIFEASASGLDLNGLTYPSADGTTGQFLKTNGSGVLSFDDTPAPTRAGTYSWSGYATDVNKTATFYYQWPTVSATSASDGMISQFVGQGVSNGTYGSNGAMTLNGISAADYVTYSCTVKITTNQTTFIQTLSPTGGQFTPALAIVSASASEQTFVLAPASPVLAEGQGGREWVMGFQVTLIGAGTVDFRVEDFSITTS